MEYRIRVCATRTDIATVVRLAMAPIFSTMESQTWYGLPLLQQQQKSASLQRSRKVQTHSYIASASGLLEFNVAYGASPTMIVHIPK